MAERGGETMNRTINCPVVGGAADFAIERTDTGYDCLLNGVLIPSVISQKLVVGDGVPKVVLEIAVKTYAEND